MTVWTEERIKQVGDLYRQGLTASQIAARVKAPSRNAICGVIARYGLNGTKPIKPRKVKAPARPRYGGGSIRQRLKRADDVRITKETPIQPPPQPRGDRPTLMQLRTNDCRWPYGDPRHPDFHFCGDSKAGDGPYCAAHTAMSRGSSGQVSGGE